MCGDYGWCLCSEDRTYDSSCFSFGILISTKHRESNVYQLFYNYFIITDYLLVYILGSSHRFKACNMCFLLVTLDSSNMRSAIISNKVTLRQVHATIVTVEKQ